MAKLNLNESNYDDLSKVPDLGDNLAREIMMYREQHGKIKDWNELLEIPGFTPMLIDDLKKHQRVSL
jgi:DNA uptake protein ComE-like DNA-binding protein